TPARSLAIFHEPQRESKERAMSNIPATRQHYRELAVRAGHGLEVALFWHEPTDDLVVAVADERTGAHLQLTVEDHPALDVFEHPYAYAAVGDLSCAEAPPASSASAAAIR